MFNKNKMPPGLLKEVPSARGNEMKKKAIERRLSKNTGPASATSKSDPAGVPNQSQGQNGSKRQTKLDDLPLGKG